MYKLMNYDKNNAYLENNEYLAESRKKKQQEDIKSITDDYKDGVILFHYSSFDSDECKIVNTTNKNGGFNYTYDINYKDKKKVDEFLEDHKVRSINTYNFSIEVEKLIMDNFMSLRDFEKLVDAWHNKKTLKKNIINDKKRKGRVM